VKLAQWLTTVSLLLIVGSSEYLVADDEPKTFTFEQIRAAEFSVGDRIRVSGAYLELLDDDVQLFKSPVGFFVRDPIVRRSILSHSATNRNLTFDAVKVDSKGDEDKFEVRAARAAPDSLVVFGLEIETLKASGKDGIDKLFELGKRVNETAKHFEDPSLEPAAERACREAITLAEETLPKDDAATRVELVMKTHEVCGNATMTVDLLAKLQKRYPKFDPIHAQLRTIGGRYFRGQWMTYDDFKRRQGFEKHGSVWVSSREKSFLETIFKLHTEAQDLIIRRRTAAEYQVLAKRGEVAMGMNPKEVVEAYGFADRVYHREFRGKSYDQWVYAGRFCYFEDGKLRRVARRTDDNMPQ